LTGALTGLADPVALVTVEWGAMPNGVAGVVAELRRLNFGRGGIITVRGFEQNPEAYNYPAWAQARHKVKGAGELRERYRRAIDSPGRILVPWRRPVSCLTDA
jgi:hypothetical protein